MLNGLVLMGGQSRRMGRDKSGIVYHEKPQREHLTELLTPFCENVYWSVNQGQCAALTYPLMLPDTYPEAGPLGGLLTAMTTYPQAAWLVVPCDLPNLDAATLGTLLAGRNAQAIATAFWDGDRSGPEPLVSLWEPAAGLSLRPFFEAGHRSPRRFLLEHGAWLLEPPARYVFENVNT
jgi:molybdenum cofactor guanylyltransferase